MLKRMRKKFTGLLFHHLNKSEHLIGSLVGIVIFIAGQVVLGNKIFAPKLVYLKAALVDVEMDIALFKVGSAGLPNYRFGV